MTRERSRDRPPVKWPIASHVLRIVAGALILSAADRPGILKGKQLQRLFRGDFAQKVSQMRVVEILRAMVRRFLMEDPLVVRLAVPDDEGLAAELGLRTAGELRAACDANPKLAAHVLVRKDLARPIDRAVASLLEHMAAWDELLDQRGQRQPCGAWAAWLQGQLRIVVAELAVFYGYLAFKIKRRPTTERPEWCLAAREDKMLRNQLLQRRLTRQALVAHLGQLGRHKTTVDRWCDGGRRPKDAHLEKIASFLEKDPATRASLRQGFRRHYALRELHRQIGLAVGREQADDLVRTFHRLAVATFDRLAQTRVMASMHSTICDMVLSDHMRTAPSRQIVDHLLAGEDDRVWRTTLRAMRLASWRARPRADRILALLRQLPEQACSTSA